MEVLRTTELLETEVLEDARKKAKKTLEKADQDCRRIREEGERKKRSEEAQLLRQFDAEVRLMEVKVKAAQPLERLRKRLVIIENILQAQLREFFQGLRPEEKTKILRLLLAKAAEVFAGKTVVLFCAGDEKAAASTLVGSVFSNLTIAEVRPLEGETGIVLQTVDGRIRYRATLRDLESILIEDHRAELVRSFWGDGF